MQIGLFQMPLHRPERPLAEVLAENADKIVLAERLGYTQAWVGEHFTASTEPISAPLVFLASVVPRTSTITLATGVIALPNHHPATVAAEVAMFDHLCRGRFIFGIGPGGLVSDMELYGTTDATVRNQRLGEAIGMIQQMWLNDPPYRLEGRHWSIRLEENVRPEHGIGVLAKPYQRPFPPIALSSMTADSDSVTLAARKGWIPVSANFVPESTIESHWTKYVQGCAEAGRPATGEDWVVARSIAAAETDEAAEQWVFAETSPFRYYYRYLAELLRMTGLGPVMGCNEADSVDDILRRNVIFGSPETVAARLADLRRRSGRFGTLLIATIDAVGADRDREETSLRLMAEQVLPRLKELEAGGAGRVEEV